MRSILSTKPVLKLLVAAGAIVAMGLLVYFNSGLPAPAEANRVTALDVSISIIKPPGWEHRIAYGVSGPFVTTIEITPAKAIGPDPKLFAGLFRQAPDLDQLRSTGMVDTKFRDAPALVWSRRGKNEFNWRIVFQQSGEWCELSLRLPHEEDVPRSDWWAYLTSFRANPRPSTQPATAASSQLR